MRLTRKKSTERKGRIEKKEAQGKREDDERDRIKEKKRREED